MNGGREARVRELVERFRAAALHPDMRRHAGFYSFPWGSCTWASFALGHLLAEVEPEVDWHMVNAAGPSAIQGHDWLEGEGLVVDVTADQFPGFTAYVGPGPVPLPPAYQRKQRIELTEWDPPHAEALTTLRQLMAELGEKQSGG
ncbi:hypothetical protein QF038_001614 [Pseudarthrobacter sp. W1I19]|uniref:hypothetical protein n=1 Tax=Pseudarthrobacter sp. W1I19 TaxID=3042288 RepID=UPI00277E923C|nr:hypothetical protein [Pseudarthrobacter sp. W1I19]MDQ0923106.1 hypothetical protein [Pseudarthrobacter sp. W1I19]